MIKDTFIIRRYKDTDLLSLAKIHDSARKCELAGANLSAAFIPFMETYEKEDLFSYDVFIAEINGIPIGFIAFNRDELAWLYVDVNYARRGIASELIKFALKNSNAEIEIEVLSQNDVAVQLYSRFGFEVVDTVKGKMPGNEGFSVTVFQMKRPTIIKLSKEPHLADEAARWFSSKWSLDYEIYLKSIKDSIGKLIPSWYILKNSSNEIIGGLGIIGNDYHKRVDLSPNLCALYIEQEYRHKGLATYLIDFVKDDMKANNIDSLYLITDHTSYYDKIGWSFKENVKCNDGSTARLYEIVL